MLEEIRLVATVHHGRLQQPALLQAVLHARRPNQSQNPRRKRQRIALKTTIGVSTFLSFCACFCSCSCSCSCFCACVSCLLMTCCCYCCYCPYLRLRLRLLLLLLMALRPTLCRPLATVATTRAQQQTLWLGPQPRLLAAGIPLSQRTCAPTLALALRAAAAAVAAR